MLCTLSFDSVAIEECEAGIRTRLQVFEVINNVGRQESLASSRWVESAHRDQEGIASVLPVPCSQSILEEGSFNQ
jgi:hypothetical protein